MEYKINYETLYNRVKADIIEQHKYWAAKENKRHSEECVVRISLYDKLQTLLAGYEKDTQDFEERYNLIKSSIEREYDKWKNEAANNYSTENKTRNSEYFRLEALLIGFEKNARDEAIDIAYMN